MIRVGHAIISVCCELPYAGTGPSARRCHAVEEPLHYRARVPSHAFEALGDLPRVCFVCTFLLSSALMSALRGDICYLDMDPRMSNR